MKVIEKDGRKIVMIGKVGTSQNPLRSARKQDSSQERAPEETEEEQDAPANRGAARDAVQDEAPSVVPISETAPAQSPRFGEVSTLLRLLCNKCCSGGSNI